MEILHFECKLEATVKSQLRIEETKSYIIFRLQLSKREIEGESKFE